MLGVDADPEFGEVRSDDFVGHLGATDMRAEVAHARNRSKILAGPDRHATHGLKRSAGLLDEVHQEVVFLEIRQEFLSKSARQISGSRERQDENQDRHAGSLGERRKDFVVRPTNQSGEGRLLALVRVPRQEHQRKRGGDGECHAQRSQDREHVRQSQRPEERPRQPVEKEDRHEDEDDDQAGVNHRASDFERGSKDHLDRGFRLIE